MIDEVLLKNEEKIILSLRSLYKKYGYSSFKMNKFEEYDFYARNKGFLGSSNIITFNDLNGKLLALKPDVTLSVIKSVGEQPGVKEKVYYNENIYRVSKQTGQYKEIMQVGLENIGDIDIYDVFEAVLLAAKSLNEISPDFVLDISHLGILPALLEDSDIDEDFEKDIMKCLAEKNRHGILRLCEEYDIDGDVSDAICEFSGLYGNMASVIAGLEPLCTSEAIASAVDELKTLYSLLSKTEFKHKIHFDFSLINDMNYYSGIVFKGFVDGISDSVLSGGRYDGLLQKMRKKAGAVGFAIYMDVLENFKKSDRMYDVDTILLYNDETDISEIIKVTERFTDEGKSVSAQKAIPKNLRYREILKLK